MREFDIPVVLFMFRRVDTLIKIVDRIRTVKPRKIYLISDNGRNQSEREEVNNCRKKIEKAIDWPCDIIKNYAEQNRGVYANIGLGAKWVFEREKWAIFLEDDNLPEHSFFQYCRELLEKYEHDTRILWICGTNYLGKYIPSNGASYMFTRHLLPCGWASWASKFLNFYDYNLDLANDNYVMKNCKATYINKSLYAQQCESIIREKMNQASSKGFSSWDYHMALTIRANELLGISPMFNQIKNIGVDMYSIHGGNNISNIMTKRFCGMESYQLPTPLKHPKTVQIDMQYEAEISKIILLPLKSRVKAKIIRLAKYVLCIPRNQSLKAALSRRSHNYKHQ